MTRGDETLADTASGLLEPLTNRRAGERIAERLVTAIALGQFVPGQRLPAERKLAELLQVSRVSVRDALHLLSTDGYVEIHRGRSGGAFVTGRPISSAESMIRRTLLPGWSRLTQLLDFRCTVEQQVARLAAERATADDREAIRRLADDYLRSGTERAESHAADRALHEAIARAARNRFWFDLSVQLRFELNQGLGVEPYSPELRRQGELQHPVLAEAVISGDADEAGRIAAEHFALNSEAIRQLLESLARKRGEEEPGGEQAAAAGDEPGAPRPRRRTSGTAETRAVGGGGKHGARTRHDGARTADGEA